MSNDKEHIIMVGHGDEQFVFRASLFISITAITETEHLDGINYIALTPVRDEDGVEHEMFTVGVNDKYDKAFMNRMITQHSQMAREVSQEEFGMPIGVNDEPKPASADWLYQKGNPIDARFAIAFKGIDPVKCLKRSEIENCVDGICSIISFKSPAAYTPKAHLGVVGMIMSDGLHGEKIAAAKGMVH